MKLMHQYMRRCAIGGAIAVVFFAVGSPHLAGLALCYVVGMGLWVAWQWPAYWRLRAHLREDADLVE